MSPAILNYERLTLPAMDPAAMNERLLFPTFPGGIVMAGNIGDQRQINDHNFVTRCVHQDRSTALCKHEHFGAANGDGCTVRHVQCERFEGPRFVDSFQFFARHVPIPGIGSDSCEIILC